jgi:hypothetical protein
MGLVAAGMVVVAFLGKDAGFADLMPPFALVGIGSGLTMPLTASILGVLPGDRTGVAAGILNAAREVAGLLGVTVIGAVLTVRRGAALAAGATPTAAFLHGYAGGLVAAALLVAVGGIVGLATLDRHVPAPAEAAPPADPQPVRPAGIRTGQPALAPAPARAVMVTTAAPARQVPAGTAPLRPSS